LHLQRSVRIGRCHFCRNHYFLLKTVAAHQGAEWVDWQIFAFSIQIFHLCHCMIVRDLRVVDQRALAAELEQSCTFRGAWNLAVVPLGLTQ